MVKVFEGFQNTTIPKDWTVGAPLNLSHTLRDNLFISDALFAIINGDPPGEGVSVEIGIATALRKPTFLFRDDYRIISETNGTLPVNIMLYSGIPLKGEYGYWCDYYYDRFEQIWNKNKAFRRWAEELPFMANGTDPCGSP